MPLDGKALRAGFALIDRLGAKLSGAVGDFDAASLWEARGPPR